MRFCFWADIQSQFCARRLCELLLLLLLVSQESAVQPSLTERPKVISVRTLRAMMSERGTRAPRAMPEMCQLLVAIFFSGCSWVSLAVTCLAFLRDKQASSCGLLARNSWPIAAPHASSFWLISGTGRRRRRCSWIFAVWLLSRAGNRSGQFVSELIFVGFWTRSPFLTSWGVPEHVIFFMPVSILL